MHEDNIWLAGGYNSNGLYYSDDGMTWIQSNLASGNFYAMTKANKRTNFKNIELRRWNY